MIVWEAFLYDKLEPLTRYNETQLQTFSPDQLITIIGPGGMWITVIILFISDKTGSRKNLYYSLVIFFFASIFCFLNSTAEKTVVNRIDNLSDYKNFHLTAMQLCSPELMDTRLHMKCLKNIQ